MTGLIFVLPRLWLERCRTFEALQRQGVACFYMHRLPFACFSFPSRKRAPLFGALFSFFMDLTRLLPEASVADVEPKRLAPGSMHKKDKGYFDGWFSNNEASPGLRAAILKPGLS